MLRQLQPDPVRLTGALVDTKEATGVERGAAVEKIKSRTLLVDSRNPCGSCHPTAGLLAATFTNPILSWATA